MTKKQIAALQDIQGRLLKGIQHLKKDNVFVCSDTLPTSLSFYNKDGKGITPVNKEIGSDLCYLYSALSNLTTLILHETKIEVPVN
jgi:hypothetical protein